MSQSKPIIIGILAAAAVIVIGFAGIAIASPYVNQNNITNNSGQSCPGQMMGNGMMGGYGMMGTGNHMGYGGMQCPYHSNGYINSTNRVAIVSYSFAPQTLRVKVGTTVTWTNMDGVAHTVTSDTGLFDSGLLNHMQSFNYTFKTAGTYSYHCTPHQYMTGTIVVEA